MTHSLSGIPIAAGIYLYTKRNLLDEAETRQTIGFLYVDYNVKYYWWELIIILRLVLMATISVIFEGIPHMEATLGLQVLFISLLVHLLCHPYEQDILDFVETCSLTTSIICLSCGSLLLNDLTSPTWRAISTVLIFISIILFILYILFKEIYNKYNENEEIISQSSNKIIDNVNKVFGTSFKKSKFKDNSSDVEMTNTSDFKMTNTSNNFQLTITNK